MDGDRYDRSGERRVRDAFPLSGRLVFGAVILTLGVLWTAENLGLLDADSVLRFWPALLVVFGLLRVTGTFGTRQRVGGALFMFIGGWMLARELGWVHFSVFRLWPVFLIAAGVSIVWRSMHGEPAPVDAQRDSYPKPVALMGGVTRAIESQDLVGIEASAVMGGVELDLRGAKARGPEVVVEAFAWWGGIDLVVPDDWRVVTEVTPVMGGVEDQSRLATDAPVTTLVVRGVVIMGGLEIRNAPRGGEGEFRGVRVGVTRRGGRKEVKVDASGVTVTHERDPRD